MTKTQIADAAEHAIWTVETFGLPTEDQGIRIALAYARLNKLPTDETYAVMWEKWLRIEGVELS